MTWTMTQKPAGTPIIANRFSRRNEVVPYGHFDHETLEDAVKLIQGTHPHMHFNEEGKLLVSDPKGGEKEFYIYEEEENNTRNFSYTLLQTIQAAVATLANMEIKRGAAHDALAETIHLVARQQEKSPTPSVIRDMLAEARSQLSYDPDEPMPEHLLAMLDGNGPTIQESVQLIQECVGALHKGESVEMQGFDGGYDAYSGSDLLKFAIRQVQALREENKGSEIWKLHNSYPDAVNFYRASNEAEFLLDYGDRGKKINEVAPFINSLWPTFAGSLEVQVSPELLKQAQSYLERNPLREGQGAFASM